MQSTVHAYGSRIVVLGSLLLSCFISPIPMKCLLRSDPERTALNTRDAKPPTFSIVKTVTAIHCS